jgi:hypothetical protein
VRKRLLLATAIVAAGLGLAAGAVADAHSGSGGGRGAAVGAVRVRYPGQFHRRYYASCSFAVAGVKGQCVHGLVIASYRLKPNPEFSGSGAHFPASGVALQLNIAARQPGVVAPHHLPRLLSDYHAIEDQIRLPGRKYPAPEQWEAFFRVGRVNYWAIAWIGTHSAKHERAGLSYVIASLEAG